MIGTIMISCAIAFAATIISGLIKLVFFLNRKDSYRHILKYGLLGEVFGILISMLRWTFKGKAVNEYLESEILIAIPFYFMLFGILIGLIVMLSDRKKI